MAVSKTSSVTIATFLLLGIVTGCGQSSDQQSGTPTIASIRSADSFAAVSMSYYNKLAILVSNGNMNQITNLVKQGKYFVLNSGTKVTVLRNDTKNAVDYIEIDSGSYKGMKGYIDIGYVNISK